MQIKIISKNPNCGYCITLHNLRFMPRPKSDLTGQTIYVAVRTTPSLKEEFKRLGGASWLRRFLSNSIEKNRQDKKT